jgi:hypothetical protein
MASQDSTSNLGGIYVLKCPVTHEIKYIGQTVNFEKRKYAHFYAKGKSLRLMFWFAALEKANLKPIFEVYFICDSKRIKDKVEERLIKTMHKTLLNARQGGISDGISIKTFKKRKEYK